MTTRAEIQQEITSIENSLAVLRRSLAAAQPGSTGQTQLSIQIFDLEKRLAELYRQLPGARQQASSSSRPVNVSPAVDPGVVSPSSTVSNPVPGAANPGSTLGGSNQSVDDSGRTTLDQQQTTVNQENNLSYSQVLPRSNVLNDFVNYTYRASVYLLTPDQYRNFITGKKKSVSGYSLLFQSGGAPNNTTGFQGALASSTSAQAGRSSDGSVTPSQAGAQTGSDGRNPAFDLDFFIDEIELVTLTPGKSTSLAHTAATLKFTVVEPNGISLIDRIYQAVQDQAPTGASGKINYAAAAYLMVIRFYGYDQNGNLVPGIGAVDAAQGTTDPNAIVEKYIPFRIAKINWGVSNKTVTYDFECVPYGQSVALGQRRGTIPYDVQLSEMTVGQLLGGGTEYSTVSASAGNPGQSTTALDASGRRTAASDPRVIGNQVTQANNPSKANSAPTAKKNIKQGLMGAMNDFQRTLTVGANATYSVPDEYRIVFAEGAEDIRDATLVLPGKKKEGAQTPMAAPVSQQPGNVNQNRLAKDVTGRNFAITAGMQVIQAIDMAIRNSSYVYNQALTQIDATTGEELAKDSKSDTVNWYNISVISEPIGNQPDPLRNDYAQRITYIVSKYPLTNYESKFFSPAKFKGVHKSYKYWFTGENTEILDYQEQLNSLFNFTVSGSNPQNSLAEQTRRKLVESQRDQPFYNYQPASAESRQGSEGRGNEVAASLADSLYSPGDLASCKLKIVGDPAWIQQGSWVGGRPLASFDYGAFNPDGSINYESSQVMFEISWLRPVDYNSNTGVISPYLESPVVATRVYQCRKVTSEFKQGKFEQTIEGALFLYLKPNALNKAGTVQTPITESDQLRTQGVQTLNQALAQFSPGDSVGLRPSNSTAPGLRVAGPTVSVGAGAGPGLRLPQLTSGGSTSTQFGRANLPMRAPAPLNNAVILAAGGVAAPNSSSTAVILEPAAPPTPPTSGVGGSEVIVGVGNQTTVNRLNNNALLNTNSASATNAPQKINKEY